MTSTHEEDEYHYSEDDEYIYSDNGEDDDHHNGMTSPGTGASKTHVSSAAAAKQKPRSTGQNHQATFRIIDSDDIKVEQNNLITEIAQVLDLKPPVAGILLRYFHWNKEKLFEKYWQDAAKTQSDAGVKFLGSVASSLDPSQRVECQICCEESPADTVFGVGCGHRFCNDCWTPYLEFKVAEGPRSIFTTCPAQGCSEVVPDSVFQKLVSPPAFQKYSKYLLNSYVDMNRSVKWCPAPGCENAVICSKSSKQIVTCTCGLVFCYNCGETNHLPVACEHLALWKEKCKNESETANWILANTKMCPKCSIRIEKNQGCNHMNCRNCKYEFCWICLGEWKEHGSNTGGYYKCNRYDPEESNNDSSDAARAKAELDRYLHYYQRYANHAESGKYAERMRESTERRMVELQESSTGSSWIDVQFLKTATEQLIECRRVLQYTYVFAYYLEAGKEKNLFEYLQENLEKNTEHLTELSESPLDKMDRSEVINFTRVTENFLQNLLAGVEDGLTGDV